MKSTDPRYTENLERAALDAGGACTATYDSDLQVSGVFEEVLCDVLFDPAWGTYDLAVGSRIVSVSGGMADS